MTRSKIALLVVALPSMALAQSNALDPCSGCEALSSGFVSAKALQSSA